MGGAKNCPETPRQKMIGMMYLVLTAMLARVTQNSIVIFRRQMPTTLRRHKSGSIKL